MNEFRISTGQVFDNIRSRLQETTGDLNRTWDRIAEGTRLSQPADDPLTAVRLQGISREQVADSRYLENSASLDALLAREDNTLTAYGALLQRCRELVLQAANGAMDPASLRAIAGEVQGLTDGVASVINSRGPDGRYLFGGFRDDQAPVLQKSDGSWVVNNDDPGQRQVTIAQGWQMQANDTAVALCFRIEDGQGGSFNLLDALGSLHNLLLAPDETINEQLNQSLQAIDQGLNQVFRVQTEVGTRQHIMAISNESLDQRQLYAEQLVGELGDLDYAAAMTQLNREMTALEATRKSVVQLAGLSLFDYL